MSEEWARIEGVVQSALEYPPDAREAFLEQACAGNSTLEREVRSLLASFEDAEHFLEQPAIHVAAQSLAAELRTTPSPAKAIVGSVVSHYSIAGTLGVGGMGVVYKAEDTRLRRFVAIKFLSDTVAGDPDSIGRFRREARAASALNHPNICAVHDVGEHDGHPFIVMELLEGATLKARLAEGRMPQHVAVRIGLDILDALDAAHQAGIAHRDIKPANIFLTTRDRAKVLDFGVAKLTGVLADDDVRTTTSTGAGVILGTAAYMAPEQAHGEAVDRRADLWAFGVVLYEMIVGARPIAGLRAHADVPPALEQIIAKCLEPDLSRRYQHAAEIRADLERLAITGEASRAGAPERSRRSLLAAAVVVIIVGAAIAGATKLFMTRSPSSGVRLEYTQLTDFTDAATSPALSPDGRTLAFIRGGPFCCVGGRGQIYVKRLPDGESLPLTNDATPKYAPAFTPDGTRVAYTSFPWDTWTVPVAGGAPTPLMPNAFGLQWIADGRVMFGSIKGGALHMGIVTAAENGAERRDVYYPAHERGMAHFSQLSPDRQSVLIAEMDQSGLFQPCRVVPFDGSTPGRIVGPRGACQAAVWSPDGRWMYFSGLFGSGTSHLWRQSVSGGTPEPLTSGPSEEEGVAIAPDGRSLITSIGTRQSAIWVKDANGERAVSSEGFARSPRLSADGTRLFFLVSDSATSAPGLRSLDLRSGQTTKLLSGQAISDYDVSSDENTVAFTTRRNGVFEIWLASLDSSASIATSLTASPARLVASGGDTVSFAGNTELVFRSLESNRNFLTRIGTDGRGRAHVSEMPIVDKEGVSPDGGWAVVRAAADSGDFETLAIPLRGGATRKVCLPGCISGVWSADGRFFYIESLLPGSTGRTFAIPVPSGASLPEFPDGGLNLGSGTVEIAGTQVLAHAGVAPGPDGSTYAFARGGWQRNLFRVTLR